MTTNTPFLGLKTYNSTTDASSLFLDYRSDIAGTAVTSNMGLIDNFATGTSASLTQLVANPPPYVCSGSYVSPNLYGATVSGITSYETDLRISLRLDTESDGTVTLNINGLGTKSLQKVNDNGDLVNLTGSVLKKNRDYEFRYDGTVFILISSSLGDQLSMEGDFYDLTMISGCGVLVDTEIGISSGSRISGSYINAQGTDDNLLRHFSGSVINSGVTVSSGSRISGSYVVSLGTDDNLLRSFSGSVINSGVTVSSGSRISGSYIAAQGSNDNLLRHFSGSVINSGIVVSSGSRISGSYLSSLSMQTDQSGGGTHTYGALIGDVDGSNETYFVSQGSYTTSTLTVYLNGQLQTQGTTGDWMETTPTLGCFVFNVAPLAGDNITTIYQY